MTKTVDCRRCGDELSMDDEWWSHRWDEEPSKENVEKALDDREFRDWFSENYILCPDCHETVVAEIEGQPSPDRTTAQEGES